MRLFLATLLAALAPCFASHAASVLNSDKEARTIVVTEGGSRTDLVVDPGETVSFCMSGCFVTMPNGDREALSGGETIEIKGGAAHLR